MKALYTQASIIGKKKKAFFEIFSNEGKHTKEHLFDLLTSVLCLNGFQSIKYSFERLSVPNLLVSSTLISTPQPWAKYLFLSKQI